MHKKLKIWLRKKVLFEKALLIRSIFIKLLWLVYHKRYTANNEIALDITTACNMNCFNCEASCYQAPSSEGMSLKQINKFVNESIKLRYYWSAIKLRGGEPTLHPQFFDILKLIKKYKDFNHNCKIIIVTNGIGKKVREILSNLPDWAGITNSGFNKKNSKQNYTFNSYNVAPIDLISYKFFTDFTKGCIRIQKCYGLALSRYGYYPCCPGANVDRVFGFDLGIKKLSFVNKLNLQNQMKILCKYCGHFKEPNEYVIKQKTSISWNKAYKKYEKEKPKLSLY